MRVVFFTETFLPKVDGIVTVLCLLLDHLAERGVESIIVAPTINRQVGPQIDHYANTRVIRVPGITNPLYPELKFGPPTYNTYKALKEFDPQVAHLIHPVAIGVPGLLIAKYLSIPTLISFHLDMARMAQHLGLGFLTPAIDWATKMVFNAADYTLAPSKAVQKEMLDLGIKDVGLWKRGVDAEKFHPRHYTNEMRYLLSDGHPDDNLLLYVGRLSNEKKVDHLRAAVEQNPNTRLAIVGDGPARESLEQHFAGTNTKFVGYLKGQALSEAYASADVFAFASAFESFGLVVVEAMAAGLPVVASRVGGIVDVVDEGRTGYTFDVGDIETLVSGVQNIISSKGHIKEMGFAARQFAETQTWPAMMDEVIDHYARLIAQPHIDHKASMV